MHSIRTKITLMTVCAILITMAVAAASGVIAIRDMGRRSADQILLLLCEVGEKELDDYFDSVEQSVAMVSAYVQSDLNGLDDARLQAHLDRVSGIFQRMSYRTNGILTYYYRIDPAVSKTVKGFWYVNEDGSGFREHEVTDITRYDTNDTSRLVWFTVPKATGEPIWLPPYITENLGARVLSYNVPVYLRGRFVGVIGIELDYAVLAGQVARITLYDDGYAFINDADGTIICHPRMDADEIAENSPKAPDGLLGEDCFLHYEYEGVEKQAVWLPLRNGMRLNVTVPVDEINAEWRQWSVQIVLIFGVLLALFILIILRFTGHITRPLRELTEAAEQVDAGNYDCSLDYDGKDEVGILTRTFKKLTAHLKTYISGLNDLAYADALTGVHNKGAFDIEMKELQELLDAPAEVGAEPPAFALCIFDCNDLKKVNDQNGHDKGDLYLKEAADLICGAFGADRVFRIGGDEFAAVLQDGDCRRRDELLRAFDAACRAKRAAAVRWKQVDVARGMAVYDPAEDRTVSDVVRRADRLMYENKWRTKEQRAAAGQETE